MEPLKNWYDKEFYRELAGDIKRVYPGFEEAGFWNEAIKGLEEKELKQRLRHTTICCHKYLPDNYRKSVEILFEIAPGMKNDFVGLFMPDFVGLYGRDDFDFSMAALKYFTEYASSEMAVREFLLGDFDRTIKVMYSWSEDPNYHVRRLSSEGSRPRLPWAPRLPMLMKDPSPARPILENLKADPELYVRRSAANHLNDIAKDNPDWMLDQVESWDTTDKCTAWIIRHASRTLIKAGDQRALALFGFTSNPKIKAGPLILNRKEVRIGQDLAFEVEIHSRSAKKQKLVIDFVVHYVKKSGNTSPKVFKLKEIELKPKEKIGISKDISFADLSTRKHYPGRHKLEIKINGDTAADTEFELL